MINASLTLNLLLFLYSEAELLNCVKDGALRWGLSLDHFDSATLQKVFVDLLDGPEDVAELHFGLGSLQEQGCNDHVEDNWAYDLLLEDKVRGEL